MVNIPGESAFDPFIFINKYAYKNIRVVWLRIFCKLNGKQVHAFEIFWSKCIFEVLKTKQNMNC